MDIRLEELDREQANDELVTSYEVLDSDGCQIARAQTVERDGRKLLDHVESDIILKNVIQADSFKEARGQAESLVEMLRRFEKLEREGIVVCMASESSPSILWFDIAPVEGGQPFTTDEELRQLVSQKCALVYGS